MSIGDNEREEWRSALNGPQQTYGVCRNGCHDLIRQSGGGGYCLVCGLTINPEEV